MHKGIIMLSDMKANLYIPNWMYVVLCVIWGNVLMVYAGFSIAVWKFNAYIPEIEGNLIEFLLLLFTGIACIAMSLYIVKDS